MDGTPQAHGGHAAAHRWQPVDGANRCAHCGDPTLHHPGELARRAEERIRQQFRHLATYSGGIQVNPV